MRADPLLVAMAAATISVPVLFQSLANDRMPLETALTRVALILAFAWVGVAALGLLLQATAEPPEPLDPGAGDRPQTMEPDVP